MASSRSLLVNIRKSSKMTDVETWFKQEVPISESFLEYQQTKNRNKSTTDVNLICSDGFIPAHTLILQNVSPFFEMMFRAQGDYYFGSRPIIMLDWSIEEVSKMVEFIYTGTVTVTKKEQEELLKLLQFFRISVDLEDITIGKRNVSYRTFIKNQILLFRGKKVEEIEVVPIPIPDPIPKAKATESLRQKHKNDNNIVSTVRKRIRVSERLDGDEVSDNDRIEDMAVVDLDSDAPSADNPWKPQSASNATASKNKNSTPAAPASKKSGRKITRKPHYDPARLSSTDTSEGEIDMTEIKNSDWFMREACRCQRCDKTYPNPAEASTCLTNNHGRLRCYLCFKVVRTTAKLFLHFSKKHRQGAREQTLICGWCDQTVPFKSVSCHVISLHLTGMVVGPNANKKGPRGRTLSSSGMLRRDPPRPLMGVVQGNQNRNNTRARSVAARSDDTGMTIRNGEEIDSGGGGTESSVLATSEKQTIRFKSICGETRVFVVNLK